MSSKIEVRDLELTAGHLEIDVPRLEFEQGKTCCILGKSGSGKSLFAAALSGVIHPDFKISGDVLLSGREQQEPLWKEHVFVLPQEPAVALDPTMSVGDQIAEVFKWRRDLKSPWDEPLEVCELIGLSEQELKKLPGQLSGGMQQRAMIAMVLVARAEFIVADEPTKGLDDGNKAIVIELFRKIQALGRGLIVITHDLDVARALADEVIVFDRGAVVEKGPSDQVFD